MMMEIFLNRKKAEENQISVSNCYKILDDYFVGKGIKKINEGIYAGNDDDFAAFSIAAVRLPKTTWFLKVIDKWYWRAEGDDIEDREDCLKTWNEFVSMKH
ncbi:hypothetical protein MKC54_09740 [[Clostridium] innocuum]|nr:hypothetical protein [[Clostridium] innocuum]MCR0577168.1 hypothetical protein [[Clostridium] innocuum]